MSQNEIHQVLSTILERVKYAPENQPIEEMADLVRFSKCLRVSPLEGLIVAYLVAADEDELGMNIRKGLLNFLKPLNQLNNRIIMTALRKLRQRRIVMQEHMSREIEMIVSDEILDAIDSGDWKQLEELNPVGLISFLKSKNRMSRGMNFHYFSEHRSFGNVSFWRSPLIQLNEDLQIVKYLQKHFQFAPSGELHADLLLSILASKVLHDRELDITEWTHHSDGVMFEIRDFITQEIKTQNWLPIQEGLVCLVGEHRLNEEFALELTERGIYELLVELDDSKKRLLADGGIVTIPHLKPEGIRAQELLFSEDMKRQIDPIRKSISPEIQDKIKQVIKGKDYFLSALFYGIPGSGKTELCYQIAKENDLPIMVVDVAEIQSKWVGDSEKNARKVFSDYRKLCRQTKKKCILLFNEADALFAQRITVNTSVDQMNNSLKNIFLEGMEQLEGVLLATTNLSVNLDPAFERRFLFKVKFELPDIATQKSIWNSYFPELSNEETLSLAKRFSLSPGQIANIQRKQIIEQILYPEKNKFETISYIASNERLNHDSSGRMGF